MITRKTVDNGAGNVLTKSLDKSSSSVVGKPDVEAIKRARRWLRGAAKLLAEAANGCPMVERIACETQTVALMAEVAACEYSELPVKCISKKL